MNRHPLGTHIRIRGVYSGGRLIGRAVGGLRMFTVRDRIGWGTELDFWSPSCSWSRLFGRRTVTYQITR